MTDKDIKVKKLGIGCDHLGLAMKNDLRDHLAAQGIEIVDLGVHDETPVDYPDMGSGLARELAAGAFERGILICGTGAGMAIAANKVPGVRAVCVTDPYTAERAIASNDAHVVTFGAQITGVSVARMLADIFIRNSFQGGRSAPKVAKLAALDEVR